ncbi:S1 family peptidase [Streptomyces gobiensis]|uniref:S1 family peptidase n=1 Tax=Streptomyces gobiensis TaxID=2875706 RepID=UPI001E638A1C|nr:S1 family peptidase [Streptomyces gobiensis]UGY93395.1 S1 family peptidase [Streptomyces gobiensis]
MSLRTAVHTAISGVIGLIGLMLAALTLAAPPAAAATEPPAVRGGDVLYSGPGPASRCTIGFNATDATNSTTSTTFYGILPGRCGEAGTQWYADPGLTVPVGVTQVAHFPGRNYSLVRYTNPGLSYPSEIRGGSGSGAVRITRAEQPVVGESLCRFGNTTGWHCGTIVAVNQSVTFPEGTVHGLIRASLCAEPGDSGGPAITRDAAIGVLVGGSGNCRTGGTTFYQPVVPILAENRLRVGY